MCLFRMQEKGFTLCLNKPKITDYKTIYNTVFKQK